MILRVMSGSKLNMNCNGVVQTENQLQSLSVSEKLYTGFERYDTFVYRRNIAGMQCLALVSGT